MAEPMPSGTAITTARVVTVSVPTISASTPNRTWLSDVGYHSVLNRNSFRFRPLNRKPAPSRNTKKKIPNTNTMALTPQARISPSISGSASRCTSARFRRGRAGASTSGSCAGAGGDSDWTSGGTTAFRGLSFIRSCVRYFLGSGT